MFSYQYSKSHCGDEMILRSWEFLCCSVPEKLSCFIKHLSNGFICSIQIYEISHQIFGLSHRKCPMCLMIFMYTDTGKMASLYWIGPLDMISKTGFVFSLVTYEGLVQEGGIHCWHIGFSTVWCQALEIVYKCCVGAVADGRLWDVWRQQQRPLDSVT